MVERDGVTSQVSKTLGVMGKRDATRMMRAWRAEFEGISSPIEADVPTVPAYVRSMVESLAQTGAIEGSTVRGYLGTLKFIERAFDKVPITDLNSDDVQSWEASLTRSGLSSSTVGKCHRLLKQACKRAVSAGIIERNPLDQVRPPKRRNQKRGINTLGRQGRARLVSVLDSLDPTPVVTAVRITLYTGLREGEICGLRWCDVDLDSGVLWVRVAIGTGVGGAYAKETKTDRVRDVAMPDTLAGHMMRAWESQGRPTGPVYVLTGTSDFRHPASLCRDWVTLSRALGLVGTEGRGVTFHDLRHTWATVAVASGVDIKTVSSNLGHANAAMTLNIYASSDPDAKRRAADVMDGAI